MKNLGTVIMTGSKKIKSDFRVELKKVIGQLKTAQQKVQVMIKDKTLLEEARHYAQTQGKEIKKLVSTDLDKVKAFIDRERKQLDQFQKQIPNEIEKLKSYVGSQKREFDKLLKTVKRVAKTGKTASPKKVSKKVKTIKTTKVSAKPASTSAN